MFVNTETGAAMTAAQIIAAHPLTLFPTPFAPPDGYAPLADIAPPAHDPDTQRLEPLAPVKVGSVWEPRWQVVNRLAQTVAEELAAAKAAKHIEINDARLAANTSTFAHAGKVFACDQLSRSDIDGTNGFVTLYGTLPPGWPGGWKAVDNTYLPINDVAAWKGFYTSMFAAGAANFAKTQTLKASLDAATTLAQVRGIVW